MMTTGVWVAATPVDRQESEWARPSINQRRRIEVKVLGQLLQEDRLDRRLKYCVAQRNYTVFDDSLMLLRLWTTENRKNPKDNQYLRYAERVLNCVLNYLPRMPDSGPHDQPGDQRPFLFVRRLQNGIGHPVGHLVESGLELIDRVRKGGEQITPEVFGKLLAHLILLLLVSRKELVDLPYGFASDRAAKIIDRFNIGLIEEVWQLLTLALRELLQDVLLVVTTRLADRRLRHRGDGSGAGLTEILAAVTGKPLDEPELCAG